MKTALWLAVGINFAWAAPAYADWTKLNIDKDARTFTQTIYVADDLPANATCAKQHWADQIAMGVYTQFSTPENGAPYKQINIWSSVYINNPSMGVNYINCGFEAIEVSGATLTGFIRFDLNDSGVYTRLLGSP